MAAKPDQVSPASLTGRLITVALLLLFFGASAGLGLTAPREVPDTASYRDFAFQFPALVAQRRTVGYPLYLKFHKSIVGSDRWVSWGHIVLYAAAAWFFSQSLPGSRRIRLAALAGLLGTNIFWLYAATIATDTPAAAMGLLVMGFTFRLSERWSARAAAGVCLFAAAAWLIRPAMLAVIPASLLTYGLLQHGTRFRELLTGIAGVLALLCIPVLLFCTLRFVAVGKFGIVSFGGYNLIGVVGQFPSAETAPLSSPAAENIRERVAELKVSEPPDFADHPPMNYTRLEANYDRAIWKWYAPAARLELGDDSTQVNSILRSMGSDILRNSPREYAVWLGKAFRQAVRQTLDDLAESPMGLLGIVLVAGAVCLRWSWPSPEVLPLVLAGLVYWFSLTALTILVCPPLGRMTDAAALFLTAVLFACAVDILGRKRGAVEEKSRTHTGDP